ncbi:MAG: methyltransferase domain-containing protein [Deltaproteobacteria bacterium]|nr:methyltransferase domain-containing protein [Deltaproteobacteria bacterium]
MFKRIIKSLIKKTLNYIAPNFLNSMRKLIRLERNSDYINWNIKVLGHYMAEQIKAKQNKEDLKTPTVVGLAPKVTTQEDMESSWLKYWLSQLQKPYEFHRKQWELAYTCQTLYENNKLQEGLSGIGFGCGEEPLPSFFASHKINITVTDLHPEKVKGTGWETTKQHTASLDKVFVEKLIDKELFQRFVDLKYVDMNNIPAELNEQYDFCWSICALEHLGSIQNGLDFIVNSMKVLKPGGVAIHTTEYNYTNDPRTIDNNPSFVLFKKEHFEKLTLMLRAEGYTVSDFDFSVGDGWLDKYIDMPPYTYDGVLDFVRLNGDSLPDTHLKMMVAGLPSTCIGIIVRKN